MLTIVLTNRNRDLRIIENCLNSLSIQNLKSFSVFLVDYGSDVAYLNNLIALVNKFGFITLIQCPVNGQLWNKSRAINIALKKCTTSYFFVADIDMIFHPEFAEKLLNLQQNNHAIYFKVGFLNQEESSKNADFSDYRISFSSSQEATGMTLYPTNLLKEINGYDEFYHGWGAEDTDVHIRLKNTGVPVVFYDKEVLMKHQWHPKAYRNKDSTVAFHSKLERINHSYIQITDKTKRTEANLNMEWGVLPDEREYVRLTENPDYSIELNPSDLKLVAMLAQMANFENSLVSINIREISLKEKAKQFLKKILGKKYVQYLSMEEVNNRILEEIITKHRNKPYSYNFDKNKKLITLQIVL